jgi:putative tryptophan/tyrosine transport system substrate-binding protein
MRRREFIVFLSGTAITWPVSAGAQQTSDAKLSRIGLISLSGGPSATDKGFQKGLKDLGYLEGQNVVIIFRWASGNQQQLADLVSELLSLRVDVIVSGTTEAILAIRRINKIVPIVMSTVSDPIGSGLITSLARPGGNTTGLTLLSTDLAAKRLQLLRELVPHAKRVAVLAYWPHQPTSLLFAETSDAAEKLNIQVQLHKAGSIDEIENAFEIMKREGADAVVVQQNAAWNSHLKQIAGLANNRRLPAIHESSDFPSVGGLVSYGPSRFDLGRRAAFYVDRILKGSKPSDLPVEQPTKFELVLNRKTAGALDISVPATLLSHADEVIE